MVAVAVEPREEAEPLVEAVVAGGGRLAPVEEADALVWASGAAQLGQVLERAERVRWVQLPSAGVERYRGLIDRRRTWTAAKGVYADLVAEHAVALALAGVRRLKERARAATWSDDGDAATLWRSRVVILGGGGIARSTALLLVPWQVEVTAVRRHPDPVPWAARVVGPERLMEVLPGARLVVVAMALTPETEGVIAAPQLRRMGKGAFLVNVARGGHVVTADLVEALEDGVIAGAGLDVTDPEPLPAGHPLWSLPNCLVTPHCANPHNQIWPALAARVEENVRRFAAGAELLGLVDPELGY